MSNLFTRCLSKPLTAEVGGRRPDASMDILSKTKYFKPFSQVNEIMCVLRHLQVCRHSAGRRRTIPVQYLASDGVGHDIDVN